MVLINILVLSCGKVIFSQDKMMSENISICEKNMTNVKFNILPSTMLFI